jgi:hypothetical protein
MTGIFEVLAHDDSDNQRQRRQAVALSSRRVNDRFATFVRQGSVDDQRARLSLVEEDIRAVIAVACEEIGYNSPEIEKVVLANLVGEEALAPRTAGVVHEARKPKMCPYHSEVVDISLAQGEPQAGFNAMAQHAWTGKHCQGDEYGGDKCNFKPAMTTQSYWDEKAEKAEQRKQEREERAEQEAQNFETPEVEEIVESDSAPEDAPVEETPEAEGTEVIEGDFGGESAPEVPMSMAASSPKEAGVHVAEYQYVKKQGDKWVILQKGTGKVLSRHESKEQAEAAFRAMMANKHGSVHTADSGPNVVEGPGVPSPKMDKRKWVPKAPTGLDDANGRNPTRHKDIIKPIKVDNDDILHQEPMREVGETVTEKQDVATDKSPQKGQGGSWTEGPKTAISSTEALEIIAKYRGI